MGRHRDMIFLCTMLNNDILSKQQILYFYQKEQLQTIIHNLFMNRKKRKFIFFSVLFLYLYFAIRAPPSLLSVNQERRGKQ